MNKVLVTGGGGFIGGHLAEYLRNRGYKVRIADIRWWNYRIQKYYDEKKKLDLRNFDHAMKACQGIDTVYNLAATMGGMGVVALRGADIMRDNVTINANMLEAAHRCGVQRYFFSSSACVYPEFKQENVAVTPLREEDAIPAGPDTYYGWEKLCTEKMCEAYHKDYGMETRVARFHNIYGSYGAYSGGKEKYPAALCRKVALAPKNGIIEIWGDGQATRSYCYVSDCVKGIYTLTQSNITVPVNIGTDRLISVDDLAKMVIEISGKNLSIKHVPGPQGVRGRNADLTKIRNLGWNWTIDLEEGMGKTYSWIEKRVEVDQRAGRL